MAYVVIVIALLVITVGWYIVRSMFHRSYTRGNYRSKPGKKPKKWELKSDGHIEAEEAVYAEQMQTRYAYYREFSKNPPEVKYIGKTILASDDHEAARSVIDEFTSLSAACGDKPLGALVVINRFDYHNVWYLHGISDYVKSAIFQEAEGKTVYMPSYHVLVVKAGDVEGLRREFAVFAGQA
jgi:hypothetical protein